MLVPTQPPRAPIERLEVVDGTPPRKWHSLTLVEILVVLAMIGLVLALLVPQVDSPHRLRPGPSTDVEPSTAPVEARREASA